MLIKADEVLKNSQLFGLGLPKPQTICLLPFDKIGAIGG